MNNNDVNHKKSKKGKKKIYNSAAILLVFPSCVYAVCGYGGSYVCVHEYSTSEGCVLFSYHIAELPNLEYSIWL